MHLKLSYNLVCAVLLLLMPLVTVTGVCACLESHWQVTCVLLWVRTLERWLW